MSYNINQNQIGLSTNKPYGTTGSQLFNQSNNNNFANGQSVIRFESQYQPLEINNPTGSQLLKNQQFLEFQQSQIKQQQQSRIQLAQSDIRGGNFLQSQFMTSAYETNLLQTKQFQGSQEQQLQQRSNLPNSNSNIMITDNWTENDYAKQFEEWKDLILQNQGFISQLENDRLQIPLSNIIVQEILSIKKNIFKNSLITKLQCLQGGFSQKGYIK